MLDNETAVFSAGNVVQLLNLKTKEQKYLRSVSGGGIGALAVSISFLIFFLMKRIKNIDWMEYIKISRSNAFL